MGAVLDSFGRRRCLLLAQLVDGLTALLVGLKPSFWSFVVWQLLREFSRRANKPARQAMLGDYVGCASIDYIHLKNLGDTASEILRTASVLLAARLVGESAHLGFLGCAGCNFAALLASLCLRESLPRSKVHRFKRSNVNPLSFISFFRKSSALQATGVLLASWRLAGHKWLPVKQYQKLRFGWGVKQQAKLAVAYQLSDLVSPTLLTYALRGFGGVRPAAQWHRRLAAVSQLNTAVAPHSACLFLDPALSPWQHGDDCVMRFLAVEAQRVGSGQGEMVAAQQNCEFVLRLIMPWVYSELFVFGCTRSVAFPGLPFAVAAGLDLLVAELILPWACRQLSVEATTWQQSK